MKTGHLLLCSGLAVISVVCCARAATWTDRGEYDLALLIRAEAVPERRLALLDQWKQKYPKSEMAPFRREMYLAAYQAMAAWPGMLAVAREILAEQPAHLVASYWIAVLTPGMKDPDSAAIDASEKAARQLLSVPPEMFPDPAGGEKHKVEAEFAAHRTLGWVNWRRGSYEAAGQEFTACLRQNPEASEISAWYGTVLALEKQPDKLVPALWHWARAVSVQGDHALSRQQSREIETFLEQMYTLYHGTADGLAELRAAAAAGPFPPNGFTIESAEVVAARKQEEELNRTNPELAAWLRLRKRLESPDGETYFKETLHDTPLPKLRGTLIGSTPSGKPAKLVLALKDTVTEEVVLELDSPLPRGAEAGIVIEFEGKASGFVREPFLLTVQVEREKISGWPLR